MIVQSLHTILLFKNGAQKIYHVVVEFAFCLNKLILNKLQNKIFF